MVLERHAGWLYPFRHPAPQGLIERTLHGIGSIFRAVGSAMDDTGAMVQGSAGALKEHVQPNLAWAPTKPDPAAPPKKGALAPLPKTIRNIWDFKAVVLPTKGTGVFIAPNANVLGDVKIGDHSSIWYGAVLRGDVNSIEIGKFTNVQDNAVIHVAKHSLGSKVIPTTIGNNVTIGHGATIHACTIGDNSLIGMNAILLDGVVVESGALVAAGAVVPPGTVVPSGSVWAGNPAKELRKLTQEEQQFIAASAANYATLSEQHQFENSKTFEELTVEYAIMRDREELADPTNSAHQMWEFDPQTCLVTRPKK